MHFSTSYTCPVPRAFSFCCSCRICSCVFNAAMRSPCPPPPPVTAPPNAPACINFRAVSSRPRAWRFAAWAGACTGVGARGRVRRFVARAKQSLKPRGQRPSSPKYVQNSRPCGALAPLLIFRQRALTHGPWMPMQPLHFCASVARHFGAACGWASIAAVLVPHKRRIASIDRQNPTRLRVRCGTLVGAASTMPEGIVAFAFGLVNAEDFARVP